MATPDRPADRWRREAPRHRRGADPRVQRHEGLWRRPEATAEAIDAGGWFRTGDIARVDEDGDFFIVDRKKEIVIRGGFGVSPPARSKTTSTSTPPGRGGRDRGPPRNPHPGGRRRPHPPGRHARPP